MKIKEIKNKFQNINSQKSQNIIIPIKILEFEKYNFKVPLFLFLDSENPFQQYRLHTDKKINNLFRSIFIKNTFFKNYLPCISNFDSSIECPICKYDSSSNWDLYYLLGIEYVILNENNKFFRDYVVLIFRNFKSVLSFIEKIEKIGEEVNYIILSKDNQTGFYNVVLPKEQTIEKAKQIIQNFDKTKFFKKYINKNIISDFSYESLLQYKYKLERIISKLMNNPEIKSEFSIDN